MRSTAIRAYGRKKTADNVELYPQLVNKSEEVVDIAQAAQVRVFCVLLVLQAVVSYRSVPRILELFHQQNLANLPWIPHFTSVINWSLRTGLGALIQIAPIPEPWVAIIDHSIDIGTKKALVVLRVKLDALQQRGSALQLQDCECIGLKICETVNSDSVCADLSEIFSQTGLPKAIIKDGDVTLAKGVRLWVEKQADDVAIIDDIGHSLANALKKQFEKTSTYKNFTAMISHGAKCLRQTKFAFLTPPKLRTKGRFQSISKLGDWAVKILAIFNGEDSAMLDKLRSSFPELLQMQAFIESFALTGKIVSEVSEILKNKGLNRQSYRECYALSKTLPRGSKVKRQLQTWLKKHFKIQKQLATPALPVSSDIIESLFGNYKHILERSPQADMNRSVLLIPALCGNRKQEAIEKALHQVSQLDLEKWESENIPYTVCKQRRQALEDKSKK